MKVEHVELKPVKQPCIRITKKDLPPELTADGDWKVFCHAFLAWMGALKDPWSNDKEEIADALSVIGRAHRGVVNIAGWVKPVGFMHRSSWV